MAFTARSEPARQAILAAARRHFGHNGYDRTTVRGVASDAGVDPSMVMRYYGSKNGLFSAAIDIDLQLPDVAGIPLDHVAALLARHFISLWEGELSDETMVILLRSAVTNPIAAERVRAVFGHQVAALVRTATNDSPDSATRAGMISSQLLGVALTRYVLRLPPVVALDPGTLVVLLTPVLHLHLTGQT